MTVQPTISQASLDELFAPKVAPRVESDDLFADAPRAPERRTARVTCRACERPCEVAIDAPGKLCEHCRGDLDATVAHVRRRLASAEQLVDERQTRLDADVAHTDGATRARWAAYELCMGDDPRVVEVRRRVRAGEVVGPFADLVARQIDTLDALDRWADARACAEQALQEVDAGHARPRK